MEYNINNYLLLEIKCLEVNDSIIFPYLDNEILQYNVCSRWIAPNCEAYECKIIDFLRDEGLTELSDYEFCKKYYGYDPINYEPSSEMWPECKQEDYAALTRAVYNIFKLILNNVPVYKKINISDITLRL